MWLDATRAKIAPGNGETQVLEQRPRSEDPDVAQTDDGHVRPPGYAAHNGRGAFPEVACNAPWVSAFVESDGTVRPCFFQPAVGNVRENGLRAVLDGAMVRFRQGLEVARDVTCQRCVCSLRLGPRSRVE